MVVVEFLSFKKSLIDLTDSVAELAKARSTRDGHEFKSISVQEEL